MPSEQLPDGRWTHTFSASWLKAFAVCPEQARRRYLKLTPYKATDYTALGSAVHAGIQTALEAKKNGATTLDVAGMHIAAVQTLDRVQAEEDYEQTKWTSDQLHELIRQHLATFQNEVYPEAAPIAVEHWFDEPLYTDHFRDIRVRGSIDCVDRREGIIDWKTAGSPHKIWEMQRFGTQPTVYCWAWERITGKQQDQMRYVVFVHNKATQTYTVNRTAQHFEWLKFQCLAAARLIEAGLPMWTPNDQGWWCAEKWCAAWHQCKGSTGLTE